MKRFRDIFIGVLIGCMVVATPVLAESVLTKIDVVLNGINVQLEGADVQVDSILYNGTTYLPMRKVAELVGKDIEWKQETRTANIVEKTRTQEGDKVNENSTPKEDEVIKTDTGVMINGIEYYSSTYFTGLVSEQDNSVVFDAPDAGFKQDFKMSLIRYKGNEQEVLINSVAYIIYQDRVYISKDYYENTILPLIK